MGNNTKKKVRSLPPLGKETRSRSKKKNEGLDVQVPDRQRLIGSPAPQSMRRISEKHQKTFKKSGSMSEFPTITLSACEDDSDDDEDEGFVQRDSFIDVGQVGGGLRSRANSASNLSMTSIGSLVETYRSMSARSGLTPPPRFLSMKNDQGNQVVSELTQLENSSDTEAKDANEPDKNIDKKEVKAKSGRHRHRRNSNLPSLSPSRSGSGGSVGGGSLPNKYSPLDPIKTSSGQSRHGHREHRHIGRRRRSNS